MKKLIYSTALTAVVLGCKSTKHIEGFWRIGDANVREENC